MCSANLIHSLDAHIQNCIKAQDISDQIYQRFLDLEAQQKREEELQRFNSLIERITNG